MAQDETYQTSVYMEQGGDRYVAGSGGAFAVESGGSIPLYSGGQITLSTGASALFASGATVAVGSGGVVSVVSGATWGLAGTNVAAADVRRVVASEFGGTVVIGNSLAVLSVLNLPKNVRIVMISGTSRVVSGSFWLTSVSAGREVWLLLGTSNTSNASTQIDVSLSGCTLRGSRFAALSGFEMHLSGSYCGVHLIAVEDNCWAIINSWGNIVE